MPTERLPDPPGVRFTRACTSPDHQPSLLALAPGRYRHRCKDCGEATVFDVGAMPTAAPGDPRLTVEGAKALFGYLSALREGGMDMGAKSAGVQLVDRGLWGERELRFGH